jgi:hypothetical protein
MMIRLPLVMILALAGGPAQQEGLKDVAQAARGSLERGDLNSLLAGADRVQLYLPQAEPSGPVSAAQAVAALESVLVFGRGRVLVARYGEVGEGQGYVELRREVRTGRRGLSPQRVLLGFRLEGARWQLVEIRVS